MPKLESDRVARIMRRLGWDSLGCWLTVGGKRSKAWQLRPESRETVDPWLIGRLIGNCAYPAVYTCIFPDDQPSTVYTRTRVYAVGLIRPDDDTGKYPHPIIYAGKTWLIG